MVEIQSSRVTRSSWHHRLTGSSTYPSPLVKINSRSKINGSIAVLGRAIVEPSKITGSDVVEPNRDRENGYPTAQLADRVSDRINALMGRLEKDTQDRVLP